MMTKLTNLLAVGACVLCQIAHATQNPITLPQLYGSYATKPGGQPVVSMTNKFFKARDIPQAFDPIYEETEARLSADALAELGLRSLDPARPVKIVAVYAEAIGQDGRTTRLGPLETFVPVSQSEIVFIAPGRPARAFKVVVFAESERR